MAASPPPAGGRLPSPDGGQSLEEPERRERAERVAHRRPHVCEPRLERPPHQPVEGEEHEHERELAGLDSQVEEQQRERDRPVRQADLPQGTRESQSATTISRASMTIESAIAASIAPRSRGTSPNTEAARVMLCATVKAVMVITSATRLRTISSKPSTNSKWSIPSRMCSPPSTKYVAATRAPEPGAAIRSPSATGTVPCAPLKYTEAPEPSAQRATTTTPASRQGSSSASSASSAESHANSMPFTTRIDGSSIGEQSAGSTEAGSVMGGTCRSTIERT
jgi:hypothetical protein